VRKIQLRPEKELCRIMKKIKIIFIEPQPKEISELLSALMENWNTIQLASNSVEALEKITASPPDLIVSEIELPDVSGLELYNVLKSSPDFESIPFVFLSNSLSENIRENMSRSPHDACIEKSLPIPRIVARIKSIFWETPEEDTPVEQGAFRGDLEQMSLIELIQSIDMNCKSGKLHLEANHERGSLFFENGKIVDAVTKNLSGDKAIFRMMTWARGKFTFFSGVEPTLRRMNLKSQELILEGLRQFDERKQILRQLPDLQSIFKPSRPMADLLKEGDLTENDTRLLMSFKGNYSLMNILEKNELGDMETLSSIQKLIRRKLIVPHRAPIKPTGGHLSIAETKSAGGETVRTSEGFFGNPEELFGPETDDSETT
jgi:CheY-like chemotaxis protein